MLTLEPPIYRLRGVTFFRDHENPRLFHVLPGTPRIARRAEGLAFRLIKYRRDLTDNPAADPTLARGGGLALFDVEAPAPESAALRAELASLAGQPEAIVSPIVFRSADVRAIVARTANDRFIEDLVESHRAPVVAPHAATFALALTAEGARLVEAAARGGARCASWH
jgi:hypothetical protein